LEALIVDDVLFTRLIVEEALHVAELRKNIKFFSIEHADSLKTAMEKIKQRKFKLVITDIKLKDGLGIELAKHIKSINPETIVIALTMYPVEFEKNRETFDEFIKKPISPKELELKLEKFL